MAKAMKIVIGLAALLFAFGVGLAVPRTNPGSWIRDTGSNVGRAPLSDDLPTEQAAAEHAVSLMLDYRDGEVRMFSDLPWQEGMSVYQLLQSVAQANGIEIKSKDYGGDLGVFIEAIGGRSNSANAYWQFWVNNEYSKVGGSGYKLKPGDAVIWKLIKGQL